MSKQKIKENCLKKIKFLCIVFFLKGKYYSPRAYARRTNTRGRDKVTKKVPHIDGTLTPLRIKTAQKQNGIETG